LIDFGPLAARRDDGAQLLRRGRPNPHAQAVIGENIQTFDVIRRAARHDRMHAAGIVADHAAERAVIVRGRIRTEREVMLLSGVAQAVKNAAGFHVGHASVGIQPQDTIEIFREVDQHGNVAPLPGEAGAASAQHDGCAVLAANVDRGDDVLDRSRCDDADRHLPVI
jgi:hypothetical protein